MKKFLLLLLLPIFAFAGIGKITVLKGDVKIKRGTETLVAKAGTQLEKKDFISTSKNGKVQIVFSDRTIFTIGKNSTLDIADYLYDESQPKKNKVKFNVLKGAFSSITGKIGKLNKSKFKLRTKSASIGIRGTIVKANQEVVMCTEGAITVTTLTGDSVYVEAGQKTYVGSGVATKPESIESGDVEKLNVGATGGDIALRDEVNSNPQEFSPKIKEDDDPTVKEEVSLSGRAMKSDGTTGDIQIEGKKIDGIFSMDGSGASMVDDNGNAKETTDDTTIMWGHWDDKPNDKWVAGEETSVDTVNSMRDSSKTVNAAYNGKVMGTVNGNDNIKMDSTNQVNMNFKFGNGTNTLENSSVKFETEAGQKWDATVNKTENAVTGNSFQTSNIEGSVIDGNTASSIDSGNIEGKFYGDEAQAIGGTIKLDAGANTANGVFKATK